MALIDGAEIARQAKRLSEQTDKLDATFKKSMSRMEEIQSLFKNAGTVEGESIAQIASSLQRAYDFNRMNIQRTYYIFSDRMLKYAAKSGENVDAIRESLSASSQAMINSPGRGW